MKLDITHFIYLLIIFRNLNIYIIFNKKNIYISIEIPIIEGKKKNDLFEISWKHFLFSLIFLSYI